MTMQFACAYLHVVCVCVFVVCVYIQLYPSAWVDQRNHKDRSGYTLVTSVKGG